MPGGQSTTARKGKIHAEKEREREGGELIAVYEPALSLCHST
jgi:hypothetical protein